MVITASLLNKFPWNTQKKLTAMATSSSQKPLDRIFSTFTTIRAGEGKGVLLLLLQAFILLFAYYLLKPTREALILSESSAEVRSYAVAAQAFILFLFLPVYNYMFRQKAKISLIHQITLFLIFNLGIFYVLGLAKIDIGVAFFIWLGIFSVLLISQFWAYTADLYSVESGHRLFALIAAGGSLGAWLGSRFAKSFFKFTGPYNLMLLAGVLLLCTIFLARAAKKSIPPGSKSIIRASAVNGSKRLLGGVSLAAKDKYLRLLAIFVVFLNLINTTGEYIFAKLVVARAEAIVLTGDALVKGDVIGSIYGDFYSWVNLISLFLQLFFVSRLYKMIGVSGALFILPSIALLGYGLISFVPIFGLIRILKIVENSVDYSIQNTTRHALFLPVSLASKYEGKTAIDTFFWRFGDLLQGGVVFVGSSMLGFKTAQFALLNMLFAAGWLYVVSILAKEHRRLVPVGPESDSAEIQA